MISDDLKGNITTVATWIVTVFASVFGLSEITQNTLIPIIGALIVAILNYYNMKYANTMVDPVNATLTETDKFDDTGELDDGST